MNRYLVAAFGLVLAATSALASAAVVNGSAAKVPLYRARGAEEISTVGSLAASLADKPLVVRIHAAWCPACTATQPTIDRLRATYAGKINFVQFVVTNAKTAAASQTLAEKLGLEGFYQATKAATSTVAVIDPRSGRIYATLYNDSNLADYEGAVNQVLTELQAAGR